MNSDSDPSKGQLKEQFETSSTPNQTHGGLHSDVHSVNARAGLNVYPGPEPIANAPVTLVQSARLANAQTALEVTRQNEPSLGSTHKCPLGWVYLWHAHGPTVPNSNESHAHGPTVPNSNESHARSTAEGPAPGWIVKATVPLLRLHSPERLAGQFVTVENATYTKRPNSNSTATTPQLPASSAASKLGDALPDPDGNYFFEPYHGGGRMERYPFAEPAMWERYLSASRFGEVNAYYHTDRVAAYVNELLRELGYPALPPVLVKVNAHNAIAEINGQIDGVLGKKSRLWYPLQGGHYRLATRKTLTVKELFPVAATGEIHLGPGWKLTAHGALPQRVGQAYRCNASHNAGTIYHEYGHHLTRHTADFRANHLRNQEDQCNFKTDVDEAFCDYLAATMMNSPHIWAFHHRHDSHKIHRRSLVSKKTFDDYVDAHAGYPRDAHDNGTILAATLWDLRGRLIADAGESPNPSQPSQAIHDLDLLVIQSLILIGQIQDHQTAPTARRTCRLRKGFGTVRQALLESDRRLFQGHYAAAIRDCFARRKIASRNRELLATLWSDTADPNIAPHEVLPQADKLTAKCSTDTIPSTAELLTGSQLDSKLRQHQLGPYALIAVGDVMIGSRARKRTNQFGNSYIFNATQPLFRRASIVLANQEGPIARHASKMDRRFSYKVSPKYTDVLRQAGFNVLTLANNHLLDCGREGVHETLASLAKHGIHAIGAGRNNREAHQATILQAGDHVVGLLGYYWNRRTAAKKKQPGSAMDTPEALAKDLARLRPLVDRIVVTIHWGVPYERQPSQSDREKARLMISLGADIVIGHHPHIVQEVEIIDQRPILYSVGNFAFGTGNSHAESLVVGVDFRATETVVDFFPAYVRNRDPRVNYQPKIMTGPIAERALEQLRSLSPDGQLIQVEDGLGRLIVPRSETRIPQA